MNPAGVAVRTFAADASSREQLSAVLAEVRATMPPLRGVMHAAAHLEDRPIERVDRSSPRAVLALKAEVRGTSTS